MLRRYEPIRQRFRTSPSIATFLDRIVRESTGGTRTWDEVADTLLDELRSPLSEVLTEDEVALLATVYVEPAPMLDYNAYVGRVPSGCLVLLPNALFLLSALNAHLCDAVGLAERLRAQCDELTAQFGDSVSAERVSPELKADIARWAQSLSSVDELCRIAAAGDASGVAHMPEMPSDSKLAKVGHATAGPQIFFILAHELAHVLKGHLETDGVAPASLQHLSEPVDLYLSRSHERELEADLAAATILARRNGGGDLLLPLDILFCIQGFLDETRTFVEDLAAAGERRAARHFTVTTHPSASTRRQAIASVIGTDDGWSRTIDSVFESIRGLRAQELARARESAAQKTFVPSPHMPSGPSQSATDREA